MTMELKAGFVCDRGLNPKRPVNQDRYLSAPERGLFAVFDGVGGQRAGEVASQTAAETIDEALSRVSTDVSTEQITRAIQFANRDIFEMAESDPAYKTMATTVALLQIDGNRATVAHVGDSRVYRLEEGRFSRETIDHTDFNDAVRAGLVSRDSEHGRGNVINRALGVDRDVEIELKQIDLRNGARFLLCSDGIYRHLSDEEIARVLAENKDPQRAADELKRVVLERGADDNLTAVVVQAGRARLSPVIAIEANVPELSNRMSRAEETDRRIRVELGKEPGLFGESTNPTGGVSVSRWTMFVLLGLLLLAASFYAGLRASEWRDRQASGVVGADSLLVGREAFERGDYQSAIAEFESALKREPQNAFASYWLGRAHLEHRDYASAVRDFEQTINREPRMLDAYVQAAAAYHAQGEKAKAAEMLNRYVEERHKQDTQR